MSDYHLISPNDVFLQVSQAVPQDLRSSIIIVGSLAAAYSLLSPKGNYGVRTKDIDCVLSPYVSAVSNGEEITRKLLENGWIHKQTGDFTKPGNTETPDAELPAVRLYPPDKNMKWFLELLVEPMPNEKKTPPWTRLVLDENHHYGLPTFPFLSLIVYNPKTTEYGLRCARPEMMALGNLMEHRTLKQNLIQGTSIKRCNKDLGRVLAIAWLTDFKELLTWPTLWKDALQARFPKTWKSISPTVGDGLKALLQKPNDLLQAFETCTTGLLAGHNVNMLQLQMIGKRLYETVADQFIIH